MHGERYGSPLSKRQRGIRKVGRNERQHSSAVCDSRGRKAVKVEAVGHAEAEAGEKQVSLSEREMSNRPLGVRPRSRARKGSLRVDLGMLRKGLSGDGTSEVRPCTRRQSGVNGETGQWGPPLSPLFANSPGLKPCLFSVHLSQETCLQRRNSPVSELLQGLCVRRQHQRKLRCANM
jgi:hypothetical protein